MRKRIEVELIHQYRIHLNLPKGITRLVIPADSVEAVCETLRAAADRLNDGGVGSAPVEAPEASWRVRGIAGAVACRYTRRGAAQAVGPTWMERFAPL